MIMVFLHGKFKLHRVLYANRCQNSYGHTTADDIYKYLKKNKIREIKTIGVKRYEPVINSNYHMICQVYDRVFDIEEEK